MKSIDDGAYFKHSGQYSFMTEYGVYKLSGSVNYGDDKAIDTKILITPGKPIGEAQVIEVTLNIFDSLDIGGENPYGFKPDKNSDSTYHLTDLAFNDLEASPYRTTISYWRENTEKRFG